jgi:hypothetical protein
MWYTLERSAYSVLLGKPEGKSFGRLRCEKMVLKWILNSTRGHGLVCLSQYGQCREEENLLDLQGIEL